MFTHDEILMPLALTVIIDNKIRDQEMKEFVKQAQGLCPLFHLEVQSQSQILDWFKNNEKMIRDKLSTKGKNTIILRALTRFKDDLHVENLYDAMVSISISDKEYKREESDLIKSAAVIWGYQRPPFKVSN